MPRRRERLWGALPSPCDVLIVGDPSHLTYFAGYSPSPFVFRTVESGALLLLEPGRATLVADAMLGAVRRGEPSSTSGLRRSWYDGQHSAPYRRGQLVDSALGRLASMPGGRIGVELAAVPAGVVDGTRAARPRLEIVDIGPLIRPLAAGQTCRRNRSAARSMRAGEAGLAAASGESPAGDDRARRLSDRAERRHDRAG